MPRENKLARDIRHIIECFLDYNRLQYKWHVEEVKITKREGVCDHLAIHFLSTQENPYDPDYARDDWELFDNYRHYSISHSQEEAINMLTDVRFPIIWTVMLNQLTSGERWFQYKSNRSRTGWKRHKDD